MEAPIIAAALRRLPAPNLTLLNRLVKFVFFHFLIENILTFRSHAFPFSRHLDQLTVFLLEAEDVNAVDLAMAFAPLLFRIDSQAKYERYFSISSSFFFFFLLPSYLPSSFFLFLLSPLFLICFSTGETVIQRVPQRRTTWSK